MSMLSFHYPSPRRVQQMEANDWKNTLLIFWNTVTRNQVKKKRIIPCEKTWISYRRMRIVDVNRGRSIRRRCPRRPAATLRRSFRWAIAPPWRWSRSWAVDCRSWRVSPSAGRAKVISTPSRGFNDYSFRFITFCKRFAVCANWFVFLDRFHVKAVGSWSFYMFFRKCKGQCLKFVKFIW